MRQGELQNEGVISKPERKLAGVGAKLERYDNRTKQYRQKQLFEPN